MPGYLPVALRLDSRKCVVVGGGSVATRRVRALLEAGAQVSVVAPGTSPEIDAQEAEGAISVLREKFSPNCLDGAFLVVIATDSPEANAEALAASRARGILVNDAETPERGDIVIPSVVRRGDLALSVTTLGASPALAAKIAGEIAERYDDAYGAYVALLGELRRAVVSSSLEPAAKREALRAATGDPDILPLLRAGRPAEAREKAFACISSLLD